MRNFLFQPRKRSESCELQSYETIMVSCQILVFSVIELFSEITVDVMFLKCGCWRHD